MFVGIDVGLAGGVAALDDGGTIRSTHQMPLIGGERKAVGYAELASLLDKIGSCAVFIEKAVPMAMGSKAAFWYGYDFNTVIMAVNKLGLRHYLIEPQKWAKVMHQGISNDLKPKSKSIIAIDRLFPAPIRDKWIPKGPKSGKYHDGIVDALLIAEYGRSYFGKG